MMSVEPRNPSSAPSASSARRGPLARPVSTSASAPTSPPIARVFQLNISPGGVPKRPPTSPTGSLAVTSNGLDGDGVAHGRVHGGPDRALCLYSLEHIRALQDEGCAIWPGALGENITTAALDWDDLRPGVQLSVGHGPGAVAIEIVSYTVPCASVAPYLQDEPTRIHQDRHPGWSRVYARVLQAGSVRPGDPIRITARAKPAA